MRQASQDSGPKQGLFARVLRRLTRSDAALADLLKGAGLAMILRACGAFFAFFLNIVIGRLLGAEGAGLYFLALSVTSILAVVARLGMDHSLLRFVAGGAATEDWPRVAGVFAKGLRFAGAASLALALAVLALAPLLATRIFDAPELTAPLRWIALSICSFALMMLVSESLKGLKKVRDAMLVSGVIYPVVALLLIWPLTTLMGPSGAALAYVLGTAAAALYGLWMWRETMAPRLANRLDAAGAAPQFESAVLWDSARKLWVMSIITSAFLPWAPLFLLGIWGSTADSGVFGAATRIAMLASFFLTAINTVAAPRFAQLYAREDMAGLARLAQRFALIVTLAASPVIAVMLFGSGWLMSLFGPDFARGGTALTIIALGQAFNTLTGSVGYLLMMTGHERDIRNASLVGAGVMAVCALALIPTMGLIGAAIANAAAVIASNLYNTIFVYRRLGFVVLPK